MPVTNEEILGFDVAGSLVALTEWLRESPQNGDDEPARLQNFPPVMLLIHAMAPGIDLFLKYDKSQQQEIVRRATSHESGRAALDAYRQARQEPILRATTRSVRTT